VPKSSKNAEPTQSRRKAPGKTDENLKGQKHLGVKKEKDIVAAKIKEEPLRWTEISYMAKHLKDKRNYEIVSVSLNKDHLAILGAFMGRKNEKNKQFSQIFTNTKPGFVHAAKLKDAENVISRIKWDVDQNKEEFVVGYEDRFLGIMELSILVFEKLDIPMHRVKHFKKKGEMVWDRTNKIYNF